VLCVAFSPDGKRLASCGGQGKGIRTEGSKPADAVVRVWDIETGSQLLTIPGHTDTVLALAWSPDGKYVASGGADQTIRICDSRVGVPRFVLPSRDGIVQGLAYSPDGTQLAGVAGMAATIWNISDGKQQSQLRHSGTTRSIVFSKDARWMATACVEGEIRIWDRKSVVQFRSISAAPGLNGAWFSPDSKRIATAHTDGSIALWDVSTGNQVASMTGPQHSTLWLDFSPDGQRIASCTTDMMLKIWDVGSIPMPGLLPADHARSAWDRLPAGHSVQQDAGSTLGSTMHYAIASEVYSIRAHDGPVTCVRFSPNGRLIATSSQDGLIKIWDGDSNLAGQSKSTPDNSGKGF
jgi:WD40 repeat protein